jgi:hypothetical protein
MKKRSRYLPLFITAALGFAQFGFVPAADAISKVTVKADDYDAGEETTYTIKFKLDEDFDDGDKITIEFDDDFEIDEDLDTDDVEVDGDEPDDVYVDDNFIEIVLDEDYDEGDTIKVEIDGIINPDDDGTYKIWVETDEDDDRDYGTVKIKNGKDGGGTVTNVFDVTLTSVIERDKAGYLLKGFTLNKKSDDLESGNRVVVKFPNSSMLPNVRDVDNEEVVINGHEVDGIEISNNKITLVIPKYADGDNTLRIEFFKGFGIKNPKVGNYTITVEYDKYKYESKVFAIKAAVASKDFPVTLSSNKAGAKSSYTFEASFGTDQIKAGKQVIVEFPSASMIPSSLSRTKITINGKQVRAVKVSGKTVTLTASSNLESSRMVKVSFTAGAQITNPDTAGSYQLKLGMNNKWITSKPFTITQ